MIACSVAETGQLLLLEVGLDEPARNLESLLRSVQPAGVIIRVGRPTNKGKLRTLLVKISRALGINALLGARGDGLPGMFRLPVPGPTRTGQQELRIMEALAEIRGALLRALGFNIDFTLSVDLTESGRPFAPESNARRVAVLARAYVSGLRRQGVLACAGAFPGLASVETDKDSGASVSAKSMAALWQEDLTPFRELLPRLPLLAMSPAAYKAYDFDVPRPAMLSSNVVTGLLRVKLGYRGAVVAHLPQLEQTAGKIEVGESAVKAFEAGCDLIVVRGDKTSVEQAVQATSGALGSGKISRERLQESLGRIRALKRRLAAQKRRASPRAVQQIAERIGQLARDSET